jgi:hypothetical protein
VNITAIILEDFKTWTTMCSTDTGHFIVGFALMKGGSIDIDKTQHYLYFGTNIDQARKSFNEYAEKHNRLFEQ